MVQTACELGAGQVGELTVQFASGVDIHGFLRGWLLRCDVELE